MKIQKVINNNTVLSLDKDGTECIVIGKGIGFGRKKGEEIASEYIEKKFRSDSSENYEEFLGMLRQIPVEHIEIASDIVSYAEKNIGISLNQNIYMTLSDHIHFAVTQFAQGTTFRNVVLEEVKLFYPAEFMIGKYALQIIEDRLGYVMTEDEAASVAIHFINAEYSSEISETYRMTLMIHEVVEIIDLKFPEIKENTMHKNWLVSNLKYLVYRLMKVELTAADKQSFIGPLFKKSFPEEYELTTYIKVFLLKKYNCAMTDEEVNFLALVIHRTREIYKDKIEQI